MFQKIVITVSFVTLLVVGSAAPATAQLTSNEATVTLTAELLESLTVSVLPGAVNFSLTSGSANNPGNLPVTVTTTWALALTRTELKLYGYFTNANAALVHTMPLSTVDIPSSRVEVSINGGARVAFDQTHAGFGGANASRELASQNLGLVNIVGTRADLLALNINLQSYPLPADTYTGTLRLRAQATP